MLKVQRDKELKHITNKYKNRKTELNGIHKKQRNINENDNLLRSQNLNVANNKINKSIMTLDSKYNNFDGENNDNIIENNNDKNDDNENEINYNEKNFSSMGDNDDN